VGNYEKLTAWQKAMDLVDAVYAAARFLPKSELFELTHQLKSAASSIPSNIAEGCGRHTLADQRHFYRQARGSVYELQTQIEIARRQRFVTAGIAVDLRDRSNEVGRLINGLLRSLGTSD
jgi:four helix bundle protein